MIKTLNQAVISLGGKGTRLSEITNQTPKPLWPIFGVHTLERSIKNLKEYGINKFIFLLNFKFELFEKEKILLEKKFNIKIILFCEDEPLGEAGALLKVLDFLDNEFLFINGDIIFNIDIKKIYNFHKEKDSDITFVTHTTNHPNDSDCIIETPSLTIQDFKYKNENIKNKFFYLGNAGFSLVSKKVIFFVNSYRKDNSKKLSFFRDFLIKAHLNKFRVFSYNTSEYLCDMGTPDRLIKVQEDIQNNIPEKRSYKNDQKVLFIDRDNTIIKCSKGSYILSEKEIYLLDENIDKLSFLSNDFDFVVLISNQPQISMGLTSWQNVININGEIIKLCLKKDLIISCFYICPHHPHSGYNGELKYLKINCFCRKPNPGMFFEASFSRNINLEKSLMIGDSYADKYAAKNAGVPFAWINSL